MRALPPLAALIVAVLIPFQQARAADDGVNLATATCGAMKTDGPTSPRLLAAAYAGRIAATSKHARLSPELVKTIVETLDRACDGTTDTADRKLADVISGIAIPAKTDKDRDFATLTCAQLAPLWKEEARQIVPFLVGLRDGAANTPITRAGLDKVGQGLPKLCREPGNETRRVTELTNDLK